MPGDNNQTFADLENVFAKNLEQDFLEEYLLKTDQMLSFYQSFRLLIYFMPKLSQLSWLISVISDLKALPVFF